MTEYQRGYNDGLDRAALTIQRRADKMRTFDNVTANTIAAIFEELADNILRVKAAKENRDAGA